MELNGTIKKSFALSGAITRAVGGGVSDYDLLSNRPQINSVTLTGNKSATDLGLVSSVNGQTGDVTVQAATDAQVSTAVNTWCGNNVAQETGYVLDSSLTMSNAAAPADKVGELKSAFDNALDVEVIKTNLFRADSVTAGYIWNCWTATCYTQAQDGKSCFEFNVPNGAEYISTNNVWAGNSFSAFVDDNYGKIGLIKDYAQSGNGYVYSVPTGTKKAVVTINSSDTLSQIVFIVGNRDIRNTTGADFPDEYHCFADTLELHTGGTVSTFKSEVDGFGFLTRKNLFEELNDGEYVSSWNIGDSVTVNSLANYAYAKADVAGCEYVTINLSNLSDTYSFFTDANDKKVATIADNRIGTTRVYSIPNGAKYLYISSSDYSTWQAYGFVLFEGNSDIATNPVSATVFPYDTTVCYADGLKLENGQTLGGMDLPVVFRVEKDGSGDYTSLVSAINFINNNNIMDAKVYVGKGEWDIISELGSAYMEAVSSTPTTWGLVLKNRIHIICSSNSVIKAKYPHTGNNQANVKTYFSAFNAGVNGFTLENANIETDWIRYTIHDDRGADGGEGYVNRYIGCSMKHTNGGYGDCIGGGIGTNGFIEIKDCYFEGDNNVDRLAYYHGNNFHTQTDAQCKIIVNGNYFAGIGTFKMTNYGDSTKPTYAYVSNNSFGSNPEVTNGSYPDPIIQNMKLVAWNNEVRSN